MQCQNNLVQLILAVNSYEMAHGAYPAGTISSQRPIKNSPTVSHVSWIVPILPYLEQQNVYDHLDQSVSVYDAKNQPVRSLGLSVLTCPTSSSRISGYSGYAGLHHDIEAPIDTDNHGIFFLNSDVQYQDVSDGAAQTLYLGEKISLNGDLGWVSGTRATLRNTGSRLNAIRTGGMRLPIPTRPPGVAEKESGNANSAATRPRLAPLTVGGFASDHPGGANFARGDGSVRLLSDGIATAVYQQLGHRSDGGLLDAEY
jgi:prepilin-type processing-associated H-X9-DG protein